MPREVSVVLRTVAFALAAFAAALIHKQISGESHYESMFFFLLFFCGLAIADASETKSQLKQFRKESAKKIVECPYGYGLCYAFPFGYKPCKQDIGSPDESDGHCAGSGCGER